MDIKDSTGIPFVSVMWKDAWADAVASVTLKDVHETHKPEMIWSKGWLLYQDDEGISIASEYCADGSYRGRSFIPNGMIIIIDHVDLTKPKPKRRKKPVPI